MESLAYLHAATSYESPNPDPEVVGFDNLNLPSPAVMGLAGAAIAASVLGGTPDRAMAATTVSLGSSGKAVESIQKALGVAVDGQYGVKTQAAVMDFQIRSGLKEIDGVVGQETAKALGLDENYRPVGYVVTNTGIGLNVRQGPGVGYYIVGGAPDGAFLSQDYETIIYNDGYAWTPLHTGGWVASDYTYSPGYRPVNYYPDDQYDNGYYDNSHYDNGYYDNGYYDNGYYDNGYRNSSYYGGDCYRNVSYGGEGGVVATYSGIGLNVRSGPGRDFVRIDGADEGSFVGTDGGVIYRDGYAWQRTRYGGWVATDYLY